MTNGHTPVRQNHGHDANLHSRTGYRNASTSIASLASGVAWLCSMPWKRPFLWYNPFNRLHLQVKWHATNQQSMRGGHNRQKPAGDGAKRPPPKGGQFSTGWYSQVPNSKQSGMASRFTKRCTVAKIRGRRSTCFGNYAPLETVGCVVGGRRWSPVRPSIVIGVSLVDVQNSWQAQHFHVQNSCTHEVTRIRGRRSTL